MIFLRAVGKSKIAGAINDVEKILVGLSTILVPEIAYALVYVFSLNHTLATLTLGAVTLAELWIALSALGRVQGISGK